MNLSRITCAFSALALLSITGCDAIRAIPSGEDSVRVVEVAIFEGGYGIEWHRSMAEQFNREHADEGFRIELWGDPRTADILKPRLLRGDPPDLILDERLPVWLLIAAGKLVPFTDALARPAHGGDSSWGDAFATGMLDMFRSDGQVYAIPAAYGAWLCWYDARQFREHGWEVPETWDAFLELCDTIQAEGIAPIALQGKYINFYGWNTYVSLLHSAGGLAAINRVNALEPGAFSHPDAVRAAAFMQELATKYFQRGALAMTHTESQLQFVNNHAAMIFCGIWLENEMKASMPPDIELRSFSLPPVADARGNSAMLHGQGMEFLFVPKDARYPEEAFEFARYLVSPQFAPDMARSIGVISPLAGGTPPESVTPALQSVLNAIDRAPGIYNVRLRTLFPEWTTQVMQGAISALFRGEITPEEFGERMDAGLARSVEQTERPIPPYTPYDAAAFGELP
ncbi:MAG: extracellular solute-binding protein [Candidatus Hydrogenedentes bacterium]|nr:extracellular solute-binding protein [Candidatus Hydrogenedentota bacterium]